MAETVVRARVLVFEAAFVACLAAGPRHEARSFLIIVYVNLTMLLRPARGSSTREELAEVTTNLNPQTHDTVEALSRTEQTSRLLTVKDIKAKDIKVRVAATAGSN